MHPATEVYCHALIDGNLQTVKHCIKENHNHYANHYGMVTSAKYGHLSILKYFIEEKKCDPTYENNKAFISCAENGHIEIAKYLVEAGCDPKVENHRALREAIQRGHSKLFEYLVSFNKKLDGLRHQEVFFLAIKGGSVEIVKYFANVMYINEEIGSSAWSRSIDKGNVEIVKYLCSLGFAREVLYPGKGFYTYLDKAAESGKYEVVKFLVSLGYDCAGHKYFALHQSYHQGFDKIFDCLFRNLTRKQRDHYISTNREYIGHKNKKNLQSEILIKKYFKIKPFWEKILSPISMHSQLMFIE
jgi:hypothetical protein